MPDSAVHALNVRCDLCNVCATTERVECKYAPRLIDRIEQQILCSRRYRILSDWPSILQESPVNNFNCRIFSTNPLSTVSKVLSFGSVLIRSFSFHTVLATKTSISGLIVIILASNFSNDLDSDSSKFARKQLVCPPGKIGTCAYDRSRRSTYPQTSAPRSRVCNSVI